MNKVLVTGAGGSIGAQLVKRLKSEGFWVRGVDLKLPQFEESETDEFRILDLRDPDNCLTACEDIDHVYQLAADMGGVGFLEAAECEIMHNSSLININMIEAASRRGVSRYFFSSSVCIYRNMKVGEMTLIEKEAYPALPHNEYGWEKLYAERLITAYGKKYGIETRIARFQNTYGIGSLFRGGREKAPAAICYKALKSDKEIEIWGDGTAVRTFIYIDDLLDGIRLLMDSDVSEPTNIGNDEYVSVDELAKIVIKASGKDLKIKHVPGAVGVQSRNFSNHKIKSLGFKPKWSLEKGIKETYNWIERQWKA